MSRYHFQYLLVVLILLLLAMPFVHFLRSEAYPILVPIVVTIIFSGMLITAVFTVSENRRSAMIAATLAVPSIFLQGLNLLLEQDGILIAHYLLSMTFLAYTIIIIIRFLFTDQRVTSNTIYASLCVYLLLGVLWSIGYSLIDILQPGSFTFASTESELIRSMRFGARQSLYPLYYSYVTLTTLGYGDIVPASGTTKMFAVVEALTGQLYIAVLVARLVGLHISQSIKENPRNEL